MDTPGTPIAAEPQGPGPTSLGSRLVNIFATPGEVFEEIKTAKPATRNWLVPMLLACVAGMVSIWVMFSQPSVQQQMRDQQEKRFQKMVDAGKLSVADKDRIVDQVEKIGPIMAKVGGSVGVVVMSFAMLFLVALAIWLIGSKLFKGQFTYMKAVEVVGLASMIGVLDAIVTTLLVVATGSMTAKLGPALLIQDFDPSKLPHMLAASLSLVQLWYVGVLAVGMAKLSGASFGKAATWLYAVWCCLMFGMVTVGWAISRAAGSM